MASLIKIVILEENFKWHLEAFASELFTYTSTSLRPVGQINASHVSNVPVLCSGSFFFPCLSVTATCMMSLNSTQQELPLLRSNSAWLNKHI